MTDYSRARAALELDAKQTILPRSVAQQALAQALRELLPIEHAIAYVVCNRLLDPETGEHCEFDGDLIFRDERTSCPGCYRPIRLSESEWADGDADPRFVR